MSKEWKKTLNMPRTDFKMKASLKIKELHYRKFWKENQIYKKALKQNKGNDLFFLHDGPPYANGSLHLGHALNKILKDIILRYKNLQGFHVPFVFGWDTHGLPIENKILNQNNIKSLTSFEIRKKAKEYALQQVEIQSQQFLLMQLFPLLENKYITLDNEFVINQLILFKKMILNNMIYQDLKPVFWSPSSETALAEAEVEYKNISSPQIIVAFKIININQKNKNIKKDDFLLIMTTTPWTLIANSAVAVKKNILYVLLEVDNKRYILSENLILEVAKLSKWINYKIIASFEGSELIDLEYERPIKINKSGFVIHSEHVNLNEGTGLVHIAPLFGEDDYFLGKKYNLEMIMHVDKKGYFNQEADEYKELFYLDANKEIGNFLTKKNMLLSLKFIKNSYPHDWRTKKPIIYRGTKQWFVSIEKLKKRILDSIKNVQSIPEWGINNLKKMIENRNEWIISRQRVWGVPIIVFYDKDQKPVLEKEIFDHVIDLIKKENVNIWWEKTANELLPLKFQNKGFTKEKDIMDVWFDSGSSHLTIQTRGDKFNLSLKKFDLYLEGLDQYRGWFNSSIILSNFINKDAPFKKIISHGFVLDKKQQKMSKSIGNIIDPITIIEKFGADILRLWIANSEYTSDVSISEDILKQNIEIYRRFRNSIKFMLGNIYDFEEKMKPKKLLGIHALIEEQIENFKFKIKKAYQNFKFINVIKITNQMLINLSSFYFEFNKDTLYIEKSNNLERRSIQTNIFNFLNFLLKNLSPILPTTMEEAYSFLIKKNKKESIFLESCFEKGSLKNDLEKKWNIFFVLKDKVYKMIEKAKKNNLIKRSNEIHLKIPFEYSVFNILDLQKMLMIGKISFDKDFKIEKFDSIKCPRCWNHFEEQNIKEKLCLRCYKIINDF